MWVLLLWWAHCVGGLEAWLASSLAGCQVLPCTDAAGCCLAGPDHKVACGTLGGPRASAGPLVGSQGLKTSGTVAYLLAGEARSWG